MIDQMHNYRPRHHYDWLINQMVGHPSKSDPNIYNMAMFMHMTASRIFAIISTSFTFILQTFGSRARRLDICKLQMPGPSIPSISSVSPVSKIMVTLIVFSTAHLYTGLFVSQLVNLPSKRVTDSDSWMLCLG